MLSACQRSQCEEVKGDMYRGKPVWRFVCKCGSHKVSTLKELQAGNLRPLNDKGSEMLYASPVKQYVCIVCMHVGINVKIMIQ